MTFQKLIDEVQKGLVPQPLRTARVERAEAIPIANGERRVEEPPQRAQCHRQRRRQDLAPRHRRCGERGAASAKVLVLILTILQRSAGKAPTHST